MASSTSAEILISRPCSSHVYQDTPTPASTATSSRRKPGVRRPRESPTAIPAAAGVIRARRDRRNSRISAARRARASTGSLAISISPG